MKTLKQRILTIAAVLSISACGAKHRSSPELQAYAFIFETEAAERGLSVTAAPMVLVDELSDKKLAPNIVGACRKGQIEILKSVMVYSERYVEAVVMHEQGHCALGLSHVDDDHALMRPKLFSGGDYDYARTELLDQMFESAQK